MLWKPRKGTIISSWRNQGRYTEKVAFEPALKVGMAIFYFAREIFDYSVEKEK